MLTASSADEYWSYMTEVAAPVIAGLSMVDEEARDRIRDLVVEQVQRFDADGGVEVPIHARCIVATR